MNNMIQTKQLPSGLYYSESIQQSVKKIHEKVSAIVRAEHELFKIPLLDFERSNLNSQWRNERRDRGGGEGGRDSFACWLRLNATQLNRDIDFCGPSFMFL